ncbi:PREDICTED: uncharacterized protein LOC108371259 [Rhagoletis zephyria]|uniref:uncharacterized protein LOC108371259 n=1 Tax=Rhagoletis zephyria TaxID=28612 RepID=UPI000811432B|nr:PREDICTED: uncharacterized protein LOC108371259 [Rhagoletis zephyria]XP_017482267.1 PREDICTED: uncharacterized protein LOC108371259 [Rhagoletis zephyria]XP_036339671.1 uncharacterized protein LOC118748998 [Rhagoletis pomonella]
MLLFTRNSNFKRAFSYFTLGLALLVASASAQGRRDQFIIRVADLPSDLNTGSEGEARADNGFNLNFGDLSSNVATTGLGGSASGADQTELQAPDVVVDGLNLAQRNDLIAAAGNAQAPGPQQRSRLNFNSGLRRR